MFFTKTAVGLDIDDRSIEAAEIKKNGKKYKAIALGRVTLDKGIVEGGRIKQLAPLVSAIKEALAKAKPSPIKPSELILGLPVNQIYTTTVLAPKDEVVDLSVFAHAEAKNSFPIDDGDLLVKFKEIAEVDGQKEILIMGVSRQVLKEWRELATKLKAESTWLDMELYALFRDLAAANSERPVCLIDLGAETTNIIIYHNNQVRYTCSLHLAGDHFTQAIADRYQLDFGIAEIKKIRLGLNRQVFPVIEPMLEEIASEIIKLIDFYKEKSGESVAEIKLVGGGSHFKGLTHYFKDKVQLPVTLGTSQVVGDDHPEYIAAAGFALKALDKGRWQSEPLLEFDNLTDKSWLDDNKQKPSKDNKVIKTKDTEENFGPVYADNDDEAMIETENDKKVAFEKKVLLTILLSGLPLIGGAYWYRQSERAKERAMNQNSEIVSYDKAQTIPFKVVIALKDGVSGIKGRIIEDKVETATDYQSAVDSSKRKVQTVLGSKEAVWKDPLNEVIDKNNFKTPINFRWLAYSEKDALNSAMSSVQSINTKKVIFNFASWTRDRLEKNNNLDSVTIYGSITISVAEELDLSNLKLEQEPVQNSPNVTSSSTTSSVDTKTESPAASQGNQVKIKNTETGWLNVRSGPGKTFSIVTKIYPGEVYEAVEKQAEWTKLKLKNNTEGWVLASYLE